MKGIKFTFLNLTKIMHTSYHLKTKFSIIFVLALLFLIGGCNPQQVPPDWRGIKISSVVNDATGGAPVSNEKNIIKFRWLLDINDNLTVNLNLYSSDHNNHISYIWYKDINVISGEFGQDNLFWDGKIIGGRSRKVPVPPGDYSVQLRYFDVVHKYVWYDISVRANTWDGDNDDISNAVEDENAGIGGPVTTISYEGNTYYYNKNSNTQPPVLPLNIPTSSAWYRNRGTHDYSLARGTVSSGSLNNRLRIANSGTGYQYWWDADPPDYDNWGTLELINLVERVAREWRRQYQSYPIITSMDMSKQYGGDWNPDHTSHQNGLDVDVRYIRNDNTANAFDFNNPQDYNLGQGVNYYNQTATQQLVDLLIALGATMILVDNRSNLSGSGVIVSSGHNNHFHVRIPDPDGNN